MNKDAANPAFYDADSSTYDEQRWTSRSGMFTNRVQQAILEDLTGSWQDERVLEIGPGTARFSIPLSRRGNRLTLVDIAPKMLAVARENLERAGLADQVDDFVEGSIYELPFDDGAFDHALSLNVFNHLEHPGRALREMARVTRPGSTLLFNYANLQSYFWLAAGRINRRRAAVGQEVYSAWERPGTMRRLIDEAGLDLVRSLGQVHIPRAMERFRLDAAVRLLDALSRAAPLRRLAPVHFCLCRRRC